MLLLKKKILSVTVAVLMLASAAVHADETDSAKNAQDENKQTKNAQNKTTPDENTPDYELDRVLVTAQRHETKDLNTPASTTVITKEEIKATGAKTVFDALSNTIGFSNSTYGPGGTDIGMSASRNILRGLDRATLILVNGAPLNLLNYSGTGGIPIEAVERIEVVRGAASTLYGAEALTGVVNIITKKSAEAKKSTTIQAGVGNYYSKLSLSTQFDKSMLVIQRDFFGSVGNASNPRVAISSPNGTATRYGYDSYNNDNIYFSTQLTDKFSFNTSFVNNNSNQVSYFRNNGDRQYLYDYKDRRLNLNLTYDDTEKGFKTLLSFNNRRLRGDRLTYATNVIAKNNTYYDLYNLTSDTQKIWELNEKNTLIAGMLISTEHYSDPTSERNALRNTLAAYVSHDHRFNDRFSTTLGLRSQHVTDFAKSENIFLPQIQALYKVNESASWFANIGRSYQMPALNQYFNSGRLTEDPFGSLKPQQGWTYETGVKIMKPKDSWKFSVYYMDIKDKFDWLGPTTERYLANVGTFKNLGAEVEYVKVLNDNWRVNLGLSYSNPQAKDYAPGAAWVQNNSRLQSVAGLNYSKDKLSANLNYLFIGSREDSYYRMEGATGKEPIANTHQLNAVVSYSPNQKNEITLSMYNILDRDNTVNNYERLALPFNWTLNYSYKF